MSFKLFFLSTFKGLRNTSKVETSRDNLWADYQLFIQLEQSGELPQFLALEKRVGSSEFKKEKAEIRSLRFKGSPEEKSLLELRKLEKNRKLRDFYQVQSSSDLKRFQELQESEEIRRFQLLARYVQDKLYQADKTAFKQQKKKDDRFEDTEAYKKYLEYQQLKSSESVLFWQKFPKSAPYRNYQKMANSPERKRFEELQAEVESEEFKARKAYLEDAQKWEKSELFKEEQAYLDLKQQPRFVNYLKYRSTHALDFFNNWELVFEDHFDQSSLDTSKWQTISPMGQKTLGRNFSKAGDLQAYTDGANVQVRNSHLQLAVKKEKTDSFTWNFPIGFTSASFNYSSGLLTTGELFQTRFGILEAKVKYQPKKQLVDLFYLSDFQNHHRLNLVESGAVCRLGYASSNGATQHESLSGLQAGQFYIFRMEWEPGKVCWKINNQEIFTLAQSVPDVPMSLNISSLVVEPVEDLPHYFEIDWVRLYQKKS
ncbi:MAG: family 16 glycosylhydrolase [Mangrovibacterium sp.]